MNYVVENHHRIIDLVEKGGGRIIPRRLPDKYHANMMVNFWYLLRDMERYDSSSTKVIKR